jgi:hypothetical protein
MIISKKSAFISTFATLLTVVVLARSGAAQSYNAATDFSISSNPNGAWSYGYSFGVGSAFHLDTTNTAAYAGLALGGWMGNLNTAFGANYPYALKNFTSHPVTNNGTTVYQPGQLALHPDQSNVVSIVRWTAPVSGTFSLNVTFSGLDSTFGDSADVHILHNGSSLLNSVVSPNPASFSGPQSILAGDTIDFVVGNGGNGINGDSTGLSATIVPEPTTVGLAAMGLACLLSFHFRKRK